MSPLLRTHWTIFDISIITYLTHKVELSDIQNFILSKSNYIFSESSVDYLLKDMLQASQSFILLGAQNHHSFILNSQF